MSDAERMRRALEEIANQAGDPYEEDNRNREILRVIEAMATTALSSASAPGEGWRPISTAPRDGLHILIATRSFIGGVVQAYFDPGDGCFRDFEGDTYEDATHWQPLPAPPLKGTEL